MDRLWCPGKLIAPQEFTMMIILKGELTSVFNSIKRAGANLSLSDASGVHAVGYPFSFCFFIYES